jgi:MSHA biogenesis protein MshO
MNRKDQKGFTLIELVITILIIGILSGILFTVLRGPMQAYIDVERRARLVDIADTALQRMTREIRLALPNSVRINAGPTVEFLRTLDGGRYRAVSDGVSVVCGAAGATLDFTLAIDCFEVMGSLDNFAAVVPGVSRLVIYNTGQVNANAYAGDNIATVTAAAVNSVSFTGAPPFPFASPRQRFFIVDTPVSFVCGGGTINRFDSYPVGGAVVGVGNVLVNRVTACNFSYDPGSATRAGLVTLSITIQDPDLAGASVTLLQQAHVDNLP